MRMWAISLFFGFLCLLYGAQGLDCRDKNSMQQEQAKCFAAYNITLEINGEDLQNALQNDPEAVCRQKTQYKAAFGCAMDVGRRCMPAGYEDYIPSASSMRDIVDTLCDNSDDVDLQCALSKTSELFDCGYNKALANGASSGSQKDFLCNSYRRNVDCYKQVMPACGCRTAEVYVDMNKMINPPACAPITTPTPTCSTEQSEIGFSNIFGAINVPDFEKCGIQRTALQCFQNERLGIMELFNPGEQDNTSPVQQFFNKDFVGKLCAKKEGLKRAFSCAYSAVKLCVRDTEYLSYQPDVSKYLTAIDDVCETNDDINYRCLIGVMKKFTECGSEKAANMSFNGLENLKDNICKAARYSAECLAEVMPECGCPTTRLVVKSVKNFNPPVCSAIETATPRCNPSTGAFESENGGGRQTFGVASLIMMLLAWVMSRVVV